MAPKVKLTYYDARGAGEPIRYLLAYAEIDYEDKRVTIEEWAKIKSSFPFGQMPTLEIDGKVANQSTSICRYIAKENGLAGSDNWESLQIDAIADTIADFKEAINIYGWRTPEAEKPKKEETLMKETIPLYLSRFEKKIENNNGYFVNGKLSYADIIFAGSVEYFNAVMKKDITDGYPKLKALVEKVHNIPRIKEWINKRPKTPF